MNSTVVRWPLDHHSRMLELVTGLQQDFLRSGVLESAVATILDPLLSYTDSSVVVVAQLLDAPADRCDVAEHREDGVVADATLASTLRVIAAAGVEGAGAGATAAIVDDGPWARAVRTLAPVVATWSSSTTTGPQLLGVPLSSLVAIPLAGDSGVVGVLVLANRRSGFEEGLVDALRPLASALALLVEAREGRRRGARIEGDLRRWSDLFAVAIEQTDVVVITTDLVGVVEFMNPAARRLLAVDEHSSRLPCEIVAFFAADELARATADSGAETPFSAVVAHARVGDGVDRREWTWVTSTGVRVPVMVALTLLRDAAGAAVGWVVVAQELTALRAAEAERLRAARLEVQLGDLRRREVEAARISEAYEYVSASRSLREALRVIAAFLPSIFGEAPPQLLVQRSSTRQNPNDDGARSRVEGGLDDDEALPVNLRAVEERACWSLKTGQRFVSEPHGLRCPHLPDDHRAWVCTPLDDGAGTVAVLAAPLTAPRSSERAMPADDDDEGARRAASVVDLARQLSGVLANLRLRRTLEEQATHDPLTGAVNRRQLDAELRRTAHRHGRTGEPFGLLAIDVDHFKRVNDRFGHERGDRVLAGLGALLRRRLRASDVLARIGGEEFVVVLRDVDRITTAALAESFRAAVEAGRLADDDVPCTCSIGALHVERLDVPLEKLLRRADRALYVAKASGRNRVVFDADDSGGADACASNGPPHDDDNARCTESG